MNIFQVAGNNEQKPEATQETPVAGGDVPAEQATKDPSDNTNLNPDGTQVKHTEKQEPTIVLDGPLSRIYTQSLNLIYAKEDTGTMAMIIDASQRERDKQDDPNGVYVYASDSDKLDVAELTKMQNWMQENQKAANKNMVISLETSSNRVSPKSGLLEEMAKAYGVTVHYSRKSAMAAIQSKMKT